jgi:hypothetical protein
VVGTTETTGLKSSGCGTPGMNSGEVVKRIHGARGKRQLLLELEDLLP